MDMSRVSPGWPIVGHAMAVRQLQRSLTVGSPAHAYLFVGPPNVGKTTLALAFAQALLCDSLEARAAGVPCGVCASCRRVAALTHPNLRVIEPDGAAGDEAGGSESGGERKTRKAASRGQIKIDTVREVQRELSLRPYQGDYRVVVLSRADSMNEAAENALLKTLEEPPAYGVLILTAEDVDSLLPTTVSRCQGVTVGLTPISEISAALQARGVEAAEADRLAHLSGGRIGWVFSAVKDPSLLSKRTAALERLDRAVGADRGERLTLAEELAKKPDALPDLLELWQSWWRDALLTQAGCGEWITNIDQRAALDALARRRTTAELAGALRALRAASAALERNANPRLTLEVLLLEWP
ncbi:MAG: DNA polymerase III subunit delta' [Anaerolineae bacterium]